MNHSHASALLLPESMEMSLMASGRGEALMCSSGHSCTYIGAYREGKLINPAIICPPPLSGQHASAYIQRSMIQVRLFVDSTFIQSALVSYIYFSLSFFLCFSLALFIMSHLLSSFVRVLFPFP